MRGKFIVLEGGEGVGKTTQCRLLAEWLFSRLDSKLPVLITREPGGSPHAEYLRDLILKEIWPPLTETLLFVAARADHLQSTVLPALEKGQWVVCDRYVLSTLVYQGYIRNIGVDKVLKINQDVCSYQPDLMFILDMPAEAAQARLAERGGLNRFDKQPLEFHNNVNTAYLGLAENYYYDICLPINASGNIVDVHKRIIHYVEQHLLGD